MKRTFAKGLVCPVCRASLDAEASIEEVEEGELACTGCGLGWPVRAGVPRLVPPDLVTQQRDTAKAFGWQWQHFTETHGEFRAQFLDWLHPLGPEFFRGKRVLDAGCGNGRHAELSASFGAEEVVAVDLSEAVEPARRRLAALDNVHVVQGDLLRLPFHTAAEGGGFDFVYSIGVLHHLPDPREGFRALLPYVRRGGTIAVWVYGRENNGFVRNVVEPLRRVSTKVPPSALRGLAWPLALGFHGAARGIYRPLSGTAAGRALPLDEYMASVAAFSLRQNYAIVFDQLVAPTSAYISGPEFASWFAEGGLEDVQISHRHGNSWRGRGTVGGGSAAHG